jgi:hypothetical protein
MGHMAIDDSARTSDGILQSRPVSRTARHRCLEEGQGAPGAVTAYQCLACRLIGVPSYVRRLRQSSYRRAARLHAVAGAGGQPNDQVAAASSLGIMKPIGPFPRSVNEVFMPSAAIAVTRHQRDTSLAASLAALGNRPRLFSATRAAKPTINQFID